MALGLGGAKISVPPPPESAPDILRITSENQRVSGGGGGGAKERSDLCMLCIKLNGQELPFVLAVAEPEFDSGFLARRRRLDLIV